MSITVGAPLRRASGQRRSHAYFVAFAIVFALVVVVGFLRTTLIPVALGTFSKPVLVHLHGLVFFAWTGLLVLQASLAATGRLKAHRRIGSIAGWLILPMLVLGAVVAARDTVHDYTVDGEAALSFFYGELADLAMFGMLAGAAMLLRNRPEAHKRLVLLGSLGLVGAAIGRIPELDGLFLYIFLGAIGSMVAYDLAVRRGIHAATAAGAAVLLLLGLTEGMIGDSAAWLRIAHALLNV